MSYIYGTELAGNGVRLHFIKTSPNNTTLKVIKTRVPASGFYGVNGGFFDLNNINTLLSIAVINDQPVNGMSGNYGSGWYNVWLSPQPARGTLVWDSVARKYSVPIINHAGEISVTDKNNYWAQGGISMKLSDDSGWSNQAAAEEIPGGLSHSARRTALVYNDQLNIWYVVTPTSCTPGQFRTAIKEKIGSGTLVDGIFLDGGNSTQMKCAEYELSTTRNVTQMVALINT
jgi:hypothetical protein